MTGRRNKLFLRSVLLGLVLILSLTACRQSRQTPSPSDALTIAIEVTPQPPVVGEAVLVIRVADAQGIPVQDARVTVRGDMTHAGMEPVLADGEVSGDGGYRVPFQWTMSGDWIVTVEVTFPDGETFNKTFPYTVANQ